MWLFLLIVALSPRNIICKGVLLNDLFEDLEECGVFSEPEKPWDGIKVIKLVLTTIAVRVLIAFLSFLCANCGSHRNLDPAWLDQLREGNSRNLLSYLYFFRILFLLFLFLLDLKIDFLFSAVGMSILRVALFHFLLLFGIELHIFKLRLAQWRNSFLQESLGIDLKGKDEITLVVDIEHIRGSALISEELREAKVLLVDLAHHKLVRGDRPLVVFAGMLRDGLLDVHESVGHAHRHLVLHDLLTHAVG